MLKKRFWFILSLSILISATTSCNFKKEGIVSVEAGLVFKSNDIKPIARTTFYLLDESAVKLMSDAGVQPMKDAGAERRNSDANIAFSYGISNRGNDAIAKVADDAIKKHTIQSVTTDFSGKAKFNAVPYGTYYLFGIGTTPKAFAVWNVKVDVTSAETLVT